MNRRKFFGLFLTPFMLSLIPKSKTRIFWATKKCQIEVNDVNESMLYSTMIQNINVSANITREKLQELGREAPYYIYHFGGQSND